MQIKQRITNIAWKLLLPLLLILIWLLLSCLNIWSTYILPTPYMVWSEFVDCIVSGLIWKHVGMSLLRVVQGFLLAAVVSIPLAIVLTASYRMRILSSGMIEFFRHVPPLALLPLLILWLGIGESSKIAIVFLATVYPIFLNALMGFSEVDGKLVEMAHQYGLSKKQIFLHVTIPYAIPYIVSGLRIGLGYSWRSLIGAEMIAASSGIGYWILDAQTMARSDIVIVGIIVIGLCGIISDALFRWITNRMLSRYMTGGDVYGA